MYSKLLLFALFLSITIISCKKDESVSPQAPTDLITNQFTATEQDNFKSVCNKAYPTSQNTFTTNDSILIVKNSTGNFKITKLKGVYVLNQFINNVYTPLYTFSSISLSQLFNTSKEAEIDETNFYKFIEVLEKYNNRFANFDRLSLTTYFSSTDPKKGRFVYTASGKTYTYKIEKQGSKYAVFFMNTTDFGLVANLDADMVTLAKAVKAKLPKEIVDSWESAQGTGSFIEAEQDQYVAEVRKRESYSNYYSFVFRTNKDSLMYKRYRTSSINDQVLVLKKNGILTLWYYDFQLKKYVIDDDYSCTTIFGAVNYYDPKVVVTENELISLKTSIINSFKTVVPVNYSSDGDLFDPLISVNFVNPSETDRYVLKIGIANTSVFSDKTFAWYADRNILAPYSNKGYNFSIEKINGALKILAPEIGLLTAVDFKKLLPAAVAKYIVAR